MIKDNSEGYSVLGVMFSPDSADRSDDSPAHEENFFFLFFIFRKKNIIANDKFNIYREKMLMIYIHVKSLIKKGISSLILRYFWNFDCIQIINTDYLYVSFIPC